MKNELYQLVAIDKNNIEYIIELNNDNKRNKSTLEFIDWGTTRFLDENQLVEYLFNNGKIPTKDVTFAIKYFHKGPRYIPLIFNNSELYNILKQNNENEYYEFVFYVLKLFEAEIFNRTFYKYLIHTNISNMNQNKNGNYLNLKLIKRIIEYYDEYVVQNDIDSNKADIQYSILKELFNYKQFRTKYMFYNEYMKRKEEIKQAEIEGKYSEEMIIPEDYEDMCDIPEEIEIAYKNGGMDEVYSITDLDDIIQKGIRFK